MNNVETENYSQALELNAKSQNKAIVSSSSRGFLGFKDYNDAMQFCIMYSQSETCPDHLINKPGDVMIVGMHGAEIGLKFMQSINSIMVVKRKPTLWGDMVLALCMASSDWEDMEETWDGETETATCIIKCKKRKKPHVTTFSIAASKKAGLYVRKGSLYPLYPEDMCKKRARQKNLRDCFAHVLGGIVSKEEADEYVDISPPDSYIGNAAIEHRDIDKVTGEILDRMHPSVINEPIPDKPEPAQFTPFDISNPEHVDVLEKLELLIELSSAPDKTMQAVLHKYSAKDLTDMNIESMCSCASSIEKKIAQRKVEEEKAEKSE